MRTNIQIDILSQCYLQEKRRLKEVELGLVTCSKSILEASEKIVNTIEKGAMYLSDQERFIIVNEVLKGKKGHWYQNYMSETTYYRHRKNAYESFLKNLR